MKYYLTFVCLFIACYAQNYGYPPGTYNVVVREDYYTNPVCSPTAQPDIIETWLNGVCQPDGSGNIFTCNSGNWQVNTFPNTTQCTGNVTSNQNFTIENNGSICVANYTGQAGYNAVLRCLQTNSTVNYGNVLTMISYSNSTCKGLPAATTLFPLNKCINVGGGVYANYTCGVNSVVGVENCMDSACKVQCTPAFYNASGCIASNTYTIPSVCTSSSTTITSSSTTITSSASATFASGSTQVVNGTTVVSSTAKSTTSPINNSRKIGASIILSIFVLFLMF